jgi:hypothetical protein
VVLSSHLDFSSSGPVLGSFCESQIDSAKTPGNSTWDDEIFLIWLAQLLGRDSICGRWPYAREVLDLIDPVNPWSGLFANHARESASTNCLLFSSRDLLMLEFDLGH